MNYTNKRLGHYVPSNYKPKPLNIMNTKLETSMSILSQYLNEFEDRLKEDLDTTYLQILIVKQAKKVKQEYYQINK